MSDLLHSIRPASATGRTIASPIPTIGATEIFEPLPPLEYVCSGLGLAPGAPVLFAGFGFSGKTLAAQSLALSAAAGVPAFGVFQMKKGTVIHFDFEQGARQTRERYQRLTAGMGIDPRELVESDRLRVAIHPEVYLDTQAGIDCYARAFEGKTLAIIDSFRAAARKVDENSSEVRVPLDALNRAAEKSGTVVLVIHHARKPSADSRGAAKYAIRGSGALFDACASVFVFAGEKGAPVRVCHEKDRNRGTTLEDFGLQFEDVPIDRNPRGGLRVVHMEGAQLKAPEDAGAKRVESKILDHLKKRGSFLGSRSAFQRELGGNRATFFDAIESLVADGRVHENDNGSFDIAGVR